MVVPNRQRIAQPHALLRREAMELDHHHPNALAAAVLSAIVPGAGQLYAGRPLSAVMWFTLVSIGYMLLVVPGLVLHVLCIANAASATRRWRPGMV